jgi:hypothetical protein
LLTALCLRQWNPYTRSNPARRCHVAHVEADDLGEAKAGAKGDADDRVVTNVAGGRAQD